MTTPAEHYSFAWAARRTIDLIGNDKASALVGKSEETLGAWKHSTNPRWPRIDQALALDMAYAAAGGDGLPFFESFQAQACRAERSEACEIMLMADFAALSQDQGELVAAGFDVMRPGAQQRNFKRCWVEVNEVMSRARTLASRLKSLCIRDAGSWVQIAGGSQ